MDEGGLFTSLSDCEAQLYAVCDGMGGEEAGEEASCLAVAALDKFWSEHDQGLSDSNLRECLNSISNEIYQQAEQKGKRSGTTIVLCVYQNQSMVIAHAGDSRAYRMRDGTLARITTDHSEVERMVAMSMITEEEAATHPRRHVINQYLGIPSDEVVIDPCTAHYNEIKLGDRYIDRKSVV